jgi:hypothetical protein
MAHRCAILDDYQNVALKLADWSKITKDVDVKVFTDPVRRSDADTVRDLADFDIVVMMRERTRFPRAVIEKLPNLKLLITTGAYNASIDVKACQERGIVVPGDLSLVGFDDIDLARYMTPPLTTVQQPRVRLGNLATQLVLDLLAGRPVQNHVLPPKLIERASTTAWVPR